MGGMSGGPKGTAGTQQAGQLQNQLGGAVQNVAANAAGPGATAPIMNQQQLGSFLGGQQPSVGGVAQPMRNIFPPGGPSAPGASPLGQMYGALAGAAGGVPGAAGYTPPSGVIPGAAPPMRGPDTGPAFNPAAGNLGVPTMGTPAQQAAATAAAAQANAQGSGLGGGHGLVQQDPLPGQSGVQYAPMAALGGPGPNNGSAAQMAQVYSRMAAPR
jgi:hypothetical protein